ncbi:MAG: oxygen-independent coproporphyrinogen III oxidase, partial [Xanthomonadales bacterium]|nr:oxygen-independent coproporphyrinogen III oxidase [Xanthomonadales bacterium]
MMQPAKDIATLLRGLDDRVPRYTSYPTADRFRRDVGEAQYREAVREGNALPLPPPLSVYVHVPFCRSLCYYCGCNKVVTRHFRKAAEYLRTLFAEIEWHAELFDADRMVDQLHLGGGTPTFLSDTQLRSLMDCIGANFRMDTSDNREFSIEIDPRTVDVNRARSLIGMGFNRFSLGVQDFDPEVQQRINRVQPYELVSELMDALRGPQISISFDLIYGLPLQNPVNFRDTIARTIELAPDRIAVYRYAHLPERFKSQRLLDADRPDLDQRIEMFVAAREMLLDAGYVAIGLDHFAKPDDELSIAWHDGTLQRNFQGYSTRGGRDLIAVGPSAIGSVQDCFVQNRASFKDWQAAVDAGQSAIVRGYVLESDDRMRSGIIQDLMCRCETDLNRAARRYGQEWDNLFAEEMGDLGRLSRSGLIEIDGSRIVATDQGRLALRQ